MLKKLGSCHAGGPRQWQGLHHCCSGLHRRQGSRALQALLYRCRQAMFLQQAGQLIQHLHCRPFAWHAGSSCGWHGSRQRWQAALQQHVSHCLQQSGVCCQLLSVLCVGLGCEQLIEQQEARAVKCLPLVCKARSREHSSRFLAWRANAKHAGTGGNPALVYRSEHTRPRPQM